MSKLLVVGNIVKDVYLRLDESGEKLEKDAEGISWVDLAFDGGSHRFLQRTSVMGGALVSREVLENFGHEVLVSGVADLETPAESLANDYRYILCTEDNLTYIAPSSRARTKFVAPTEAVDWIFVDRSAEISAEMVSRLREFLALSRGTRLAVYLEEHDDESAFSGAEKELLKMANLVMYDGSDAGGVGSGLRLRISEDTIDFEGTKISYVSTRAKLFTRLTTYSILAGSVLGGLLGGCSAEESLVLAKMNVENAKLTGTVGLSGLRALAADYFERRKGLPAIAKMMVGASDGAATRGILAADESGGSIHKKFVDAGVVDDFEHRTEYREMLLRDSALGDFVGGVILFDETARSVMSSGVGFVDSLTAREVVPGVKVDGGLVEVEGGRTTAGLVGLPERLKEYYEMGLRFAKWRSVFDGGMAEEILKQNCRDLAVYARECQEAGLVPIVEPEVMEDRMTGRVLDELFSALATEKVDLSGCVLKVNMILSGTTGAEEVGAETAKVLLEHVPAELAGVVFLSGGQEAERATENLREVIKAGVGAGGFPWPVTFSFARAVQGPAMEAWISEGVEAGTRAAMARLKANVEAIK